jgi:hypothetical protein
VIRAVAGSTIVSADAVLSITARKPRTSTADVGPSEYDPDWYPSVAMNPVIALTPESSGLTRTTLPVRPAGTITLRSVVENCRSSNPMPGTRLGNGSANAADASAVGPTS